MKGEAGKIKYHYGFYAAIHVIYQAARAHYAFLQEQELGEEPVRLDMLAIRNDEGCVLTDPIGRFFRKYNILDYKSPENSLSINDFSKALGYACFYQSMGEVNEIPLGDITLSIFRHAYPRDLFSMLKGAGGEIEEAHPGIYHVKGLAYIPIQVVVSSRLSGGNYEPLKILARKAKEADVLKFMKDARDNQSFADDINAILRVSMAANEKLFQKLEREGLMVEAFERIFHRELAEKRDEGIAIGEAQGRREEQETFAARMIKAGKLALEEIAEYSGLSLARVQTLARQG